MIINNTETIAIIGGAEFGPDVAESVLPKVAQVIAADGGADRALENGFSPDYVIGDLDSISDAAKAVVSPEHLIFVDDQDNTDFEKVLDRVDAPIIIGLGFLGGRIDHQMAVQTALVQFAHKKIILIGAHDVVFLCPPRLSIGLALGTRVSLYPMATVQVASTGLNWPTDGLTLSPDGRIGTSNHALGPVTLEPDAARCLVIVPRAMFETAMTALSQAPHWPVHAK